MTATAGPTPDGVLSDGADQFVDTPAGPRICYRVDGAPQGVPLLLIAGLGLDLTSWPVRMVDSFTASGFRVIRLDNRDAGRSSRIDASPPSLLRQLLARPRPDAYTLADMAADTLVRLAQPAARTVDASVTHHLRMLSHISSPTFPPDAELERTWAASVWQRRGGTGDGPAVARQIDAIRASGDRTAELGRITAPTLVIHGDRDRMVHPSGGRATTRAIPGARHIEIPGMGHHLAPGLLDRLSQLITDHITHSTSPRRGDQS
ncbi:alpha/beta fold hydrolase [Actinoplanes teichomyceticus]|uniref:Pimeloyl-ACP methyl ester carboxylesterase n=1 Tax=Actinoplanes teichomyceticus TaxID=1867 RepID=A0A561VLD6_ACTTI|nr:alpha/beta fold hydrolase [Actinoplanes teichomyceticus]TWG12428.1 pimeloyl-ACP methyl ester carboxylesterase [Actinoplanes teichomyceticus]GIF13788.1 alpha/beta hydrolase [Actinoplanes teichomyceticus]